MADRIDADNHSCFVCWHFLGPAGEMAVACGHPKPPSVFHTPDTGCTRWVLRRDADVSIRSLEAWRARGAPQIAGFYNPLGHPGPWRLPLTGAEIHRAHANEPTTGTRAMAWEIKRLHDVIVRTRGAALELSHQRMPTQIRTTLRQIAVVLTAEPCVQEQLEEVDRQDRYRDRNR